jgi:signal transduction histidine kinase
MIDELLRYGAISAARPESARQFVRLDQLVEEVVREIRDGGVPGQTRVSTSLVPTVVEGNADHLRVIVDNLLSNAVKYARCDGHVDVGLHVDQGIAVLDVHDNGPGIREEEAPHVFDWFFTGRQPAGSMRGGTGMGLAIAQEYARQHGGQILLLPSEVGAHFRLTLTERSNGEG